MISVLLQLDQEAL